ncbi:MAG: methylated-DNA--[protein]-cysteine S-methyltransferase [Sphingobacteriales bacterium]|jgi:methylated-DNA-[protein]-cysteine S-methyltransferase|nr:MAG: methylated-DNA--[protein]-cysteine S-methyltransferase [Sphingobacteriales bacterium]
MSNQYTAYYTSPLGVLRISSNDAAVNEVHFLHEDEIAGAAPPVEQRPKVLQQCINQLIEYFTGDRKDFTVPLQQNGTDFQQKVWGELLHIPFGKTISYLDLSKRIGDVKAIRAAASTNGKNKIGIIVPCHRVIGSNQDLVGYAGGLWRKKWLLEHEQKLAYGIQTLF